MFTFIPYVAVVDECGVVVQHNPAENSAQQYKIK